MNLGQLKIFYLSSKMGSLSKAAEELNVTQPAVTKGIQRLQEHYEIKLFNRFGKKLVLTDAGSALYKIAEKIFDLEIHAEDTIREFLQQKQGHIRIDASESFGAYYLPSIVNPVSKEHPNVRFSVNILPSHLVVENVANLNNDIGFISYPMENEKIICREILEDHMIFVASPSHPLVDKKRLTSMDLSGQSMIVHEKGSLSYQVTHDFLKKNKVDIIISLELSSNRAIKKAVEDGLGIALVSRNTAFGHIQTKRLAVLPFPGPPITRKYYMVHHKDKYFSDVLNQLIKKVDHWALEYHRSIRDNFIN
ncbi:MAG: LysR family transcriptional regulator [Desulfobacterales bacterium]|nr:LysR family transcriptional regulator [Desulfobacterales bacterium]